jgi:DNA-binding transcriptional ArsR family regulator
MAGTKTEGFEAEVLETAMYLKALGHPARVAIVQLLMKRNACVCGSIVDEIPLSQSTVSQHLAALKEAGLIQGTISGPKTCYCIEPKAFRRALELIKGLERLFVEGQSCC